MIRLNENYNDSIVERIQDKYEGLKYEDETSEFKRTTKQDARKFIDGLCCFFIQERNEGCLMSSVDICADFAYALLLKKMCQTTFQSYCHRSSRCEKCAVKKY